MGADIGEPGLDLGAAQAVGGLGFREEGGALLVGGEHDLDQGLGPARRLLGHGADLHAAGQGDAAALGGKLSLDDPEQGGLARAVAPHEPHLRPGGQVEGGAVEDQPIADAEGQVVDVKHAAF